MISNSEMFLFFTDTCTAVIIPLVQKFCDEIPKQSSESLLTVAQLFGKLSYGLSGEDNFLFHSKVFQTGAFQIAFSNSFIIHQVYTKLMKS